jgi:hypothetical protein
MLKGRTTFKGMETKMGYKLRVASAVTAMMIALTSFSPASAMPRAAPQSPTAAEQQVTPVQYWRHDRRDRFDGRRDFRRFDGRRDFRGPPPRRGYYGGYYNGHRGYRDYRPGYRRYNGFWFPLGAFATGAIIGGAVAAPRVYSGGSAHVNWCINRYRSYRVSDNTFQPNVGPRRSCISPY